MSDTKYELYYQSIAVFDIYFIFANLIAIEAELPGKPWGLKTCVLFIEGENKLGYYPLWNLLYAESKGIDELAYCFRRIK